MNATWLDQLAPDHAPATAGWWPPAPGWWAIAVIAVLVIVGLARLWHDPYRRLRRAALRELRSIRASAAESAALATAIETLLRRYAVAVFGRDRVARLTGEAWLGFVCAEGGDALAGGPGRSLLSATFGGRVSRSDPAAEQDRERWLAGADAFIRRAARPRRFKRRQSGKVAT
jgi:hypothetical protein